MDAARWLFLSAAAHAVAWAALALAGVKPRPAEPARLPIALEVRPPPVPFVTPEGPRPPGDAPRRSSTAPGRSVGTSRPSSSSPPSGPRPPREPAPGGKWMTMRGMPVPSVRSVVGRPEGPPPEDALRLPDRTPLPIPGQGPGPLGPRAKPDGDGGYRIERLTFDARVRRDGSVTIEDKSPSTALNGIGISTTFDITDMIMRAIGNDPYAYEKLKLLDETREARAEMARADRGVRLHDALARLPRDLGRIWAYTAWSEAERRRILFRLWDEVAEDGDDELLHAGAQVRATIAAFIRRNLPAEGPSAYTAEELERLNGTRQSRARFDPYSQP